MKERQRVLNNDTLQIMNTISYLCLFLSLVGLILTVMALTLQRTLWRLDMTKIHVYLSISLFVGYVIFLVGIDQTQVRTGSY